MNRRIHTYHDGMGIMYYAHAEYSHTVFTISVFILFFLFATPLNAQYEEPLVGPLVATTPAQQDRIILHDLSNDNVRDLRFGTGEIHIWDFSPDGCRVLFTRDADRNGFPQLYSAELNGDDVRQLVQFNELSPDELPPDQWGVWEPDWSPQNIIAFTLLRTEPDTQSTEPTTHIAYIPGTGGTPEFYSVTGREFTPSWSPDGSWLAYVSYDERIAGANPNATAEPTQAPAAGQTTPELPTLLEADLWVVSSDGEIKYRLTGFETGSARHPRWSPDGDLIGFVYSPSPSNDTLWMIANSANAQPTQLNYQWQLTLDHTWLPDSTAMLASLRDFRGVAQNRLWRIPLVGNADENDANIYLGDDTFTYTDYPRFSPDGDYLAFRSDYNLIVTDLRAGTWQRLDVDTPGNTPPVWSPAGFAGESNCES